MSFAIAAVRRSDDHIEVVATNGLVGRGEGAPGIDVTGRSPFEVEAIFDECGAAGLDMALWDLAAQCARRPLRCLLGKVYREKALVCPSEGFMHVALGPQDDAPETAARLGVTMRNATGDQALALAARLERANLEFFEPRVSLETFREMKQSCALPLAIGGDLGPRELLHDYVQTGLADVVLPSLRVCGLTGIKRLAYYCWLFRVRLAPRADSELTLAAAREVAAIVPPVTSAIAAPPVFVLESRA